MVLERGLASRACEAEAFTAPRLELRDAVFLAVERDAAGARAKSCAQRTSWRADFLAEVFLAAVFLAVVFLAAVFRAVVFFAADFAEDFGPPTSWRRSSWRWSSSQPSSWRGLLGAALGRRTSSRRGRLRCGLRSPALLGGRGLRAGLLARSTSCASAALLRGLLGAGRTGVTREQHRQRVDLSSVGIAASFKGLRVQPSRLQGNVVIPSGFRITESVDSRTRTFSVDICSRDDCSALAVLSTRDRVQDEAVRVSSSDASRLFEHALKRCNATV